MKYTAEQKIAAATATQELIEQGMTQKDACREKGISQSSFSKWKHLSPSTTKKYRSKLTVTDLPEVTADHGKLFMVFGNAQQLRQFMREMQ